MNCDACEKTFWYVGILVNFDISISKKNIENIDYIENMQISKITKCSFVNTASKPAKEVT
jgi:hypothetical protein